jgi:amicyanin
MKPRNIAIIVVGVIVVGGIALAATKSPASTSTNHSDMTPLAQTTQVQAPKDANSVVIQNYKFNPTPLKIKKGTTVTWTNTDIARHNIVVDDGQPAGGPSGPLFGKGETFQFTFNNVGTYAYHCDPHPYMHGSVEVTQ